MDFDKILTELGGYGKWQIVSTVLCFLCGMATSMIIMSYSFTGKKDLADQAIKCHILGQGDGLGSNECSIFGRLEPAKYYQLFNKHERTGQHRQNLFKKGHFQFEITFC